jgi:hypothetical protein
LAHPGGCGGKKKKEKEKYGKRGKKETRVIEKELTNKDSIYFFFRLELTIVAHHNFTKRTLGFRTYQRSAPLTVHRVPRKPGDGSTGQKMLLALISTTISGFVTELFNSG